MTKHKSTPVSPKVTSATGGSALGTVVAYYVDQVPFIHNAPAPVEAGICLLVVGAITWAAGYLRRDPARI